MTTIRIWRLNIDGRLSLEPNYRWTTQTKRAKAMTDNMLLAGIHINQIVISRGLPAENHNQDRPLRRSNFMGEIQIAETIVSFPMSKKIQNFITYFICKTTSTLAVDNMLIG
jgi:hypothetical protein